MRISGRVQGVGYRYWVVGEASALGLDGWVRNLSDGAVEALFAGPTSAVTAMLGRCREGPTSARVDDIAVGDAADPGPTGFTQEATR